jgi:hypothetical protein
MSSRRELRNDLEHSRQMLRCTLQQQRQQQSDFCVPAQFTVCLHSHVVVLLVCHDGLEAHVAIGQSTRDRRNVLSPSRNFFGLYYRPATNSRKLTKSTFCRFILVTHAKQLCRRTLAPGNTWSPTNACQRRRAGARASTCARICRSGAPGPAPSCAPSPKLIFVEI